LKLLKTAILENKIGTQKEGVRKEPKSVTHHGYHSAFFKRVARKKMVEPLAIF